MSDRAELVNAYLAGAECSYLTRGEAEKDAGDHADRVLASRAASPSPSPGAPTTPTEAFEDLWAMVENYADALHNHRRKAFQSGTTEDAKRDAFSFLQATEKPLREALARASRSGSPADGGPTTQDVTDEELERAAIVAIFGRDDGFYRAEWNAMSDALRQNALDEQRRVLVAFLNGRKLSAGLRRNVTSRSES